ncbi:hypothetical protein ACFLT2_15045 [Acidobacteriota bacterium]
MKDTKLLAVTLLILSTLVSCKSFQMEVYQSVRIDSDRGYRSAANQATLEDLLTEIWDTGFFSNNLLSREEILNNRYGIFGSGSSVARVTQGRACYIKDHCHSDMIMLSRKLFPYLEIDANGSFSTHTRDPKIKATLVHELFHDFWHNTLNLQKRFLFASETEILFRELLMVKTREDKLQFLQRAGFTNPRVKDFEPFAELLIVKKNYTTEKFFGTELYSIIADRTFSGKIIIPKQLRKFYSGIISDSILNKGYIKKQR